MNLDELFKKQNELDTLIMKNKKVSLSKKELIKSRIIALVAEVGEFLQEEEATWKYWKENPRNNREDKLSELADILFFYSSLANLLGYSAEDVQNAYNQKYEINIKRAKGTY